MKTKYLFLPLIGLMLISCGGAPKAVSAKEENPNLGDWLAKYNTNYTRDTQMFFTPDAYKELSAIQDGLNFPFTQNRKTLWVEHGLYMTTMDELVNAGYYSVMEDGHPQLYRYTLPGDNPAGYINSEVVPEGFNAVKQTGITKSVEEFFVEMSEFNNAEFIEKFSLNEAGYFVSTDKGVLDQFLAFTASCYLNPEVGEPPLPYLDFKEARIYKDASGDGLRLKLYVKDEYLDKVEHKDGLFSMAYVYDSNKTSIPVLAAHLNAK